jgi:hypothetical protein
VIANIINSTPDIVVDVPEETSTVIAAIEEEDPVTPPPNFGEVSEFVRTYQGTSACFAAVPIEMADGSIAVTAYADDANASAALADTVAQHFGGEVAIDARALTPSQCGALSFLGESGGPSAQVNLALANQAITDGNFLQGTIRNLDGNYVYLLVVDDEGKVSSADQFLDQNGDMLTFEAQVHLTGSGARSDQLLVAIVSRSPLEVPDALEGRQASEFFKKLSQETAMLDLMGGDTPDVAITSFVVVD